MHILIPSFEILTNEIAGQASPANALNPAMHAVLSHFAIKHL